MTPLTNGALPHTIEAAVSQIVISAHAGGKVDRRSDGVCGINGEGRAAGRRQLHLAADFLRKTFERLGDARVLLGKGCVGQEEGGGEKFDHAEMNGWLACSVMLLKEHGHLSKQVPGDWKTARGERSPRRVRD